MILRSVAQRQGWFYGWWIVAACFLVLLLQSGAGYYSFSIFIRPLESDFGWSRAAISLTMSIHMVAGGLAGPLVGRLIVRFGPRRVMILGTVGAGALFILVSMTRSLGYLYAVYALLALCISGIGILPVSSLLAAWFVRRRGTATGVAMVGISLGGLVLAPLVGLVTLHFVWKVSFVVLGLLVWALALPAVLIVIRDAPADLGFRPDGDGVCDGPEDALAVPSTSFPSEQGGRPLQAAFKNRTFWWIATTWFLASAAQSGILQHQVPILIEAGLPEAVAATALGITAGFGGFGKLCFGRLSEIIPFRYVAMLCFGLQGAAIVLLSMARDTSMIWAYILVFGVSMGGVVVLLPLAVGQFFGLTAFGVILGALWMAQAFGGAAGAFFSGMIHDQTGSYEMALVSLMVVYLFAVVSVFMVGESEFGHR